MHLVGLAGGLVGSAAETCSKGMWWSIQAGCCGSPIFILEKNTRNFQLMEVSGIFQFPCRR
jgi:hypothetical protein